MGLRARVVFQSFPRSAVETHVSDLMVIFAMSVVQTFLRRLLKNSRPLPP